MDDVDSVDPVKLALLDVPLPAGLAQRLKAVVRERCAVLTVDAAVGDAAVGDAASVAVDAVSPIETAGETIQCELEKPVKPFGRSSEWVRRAVLAAVLAASIVGFAFLARAWTAPTEPAWLAMECESFLLKLEKDAASWRPSGPALPPELSPVQSMLHRMAVTGEKEVDGLSSKLKGLVFKMDAGDGRKIVVLRLPALTPTRGASSRFSILPTRSGGWSMAVATLGNETIVLAAACTDQQLMSYIRVRETT